MLCGIMPAGVNVGYQGLLERLIETVDGQPVQNLRHFVEVVEGTETGLLLLETHAGEQIALDRERARALSGLQVGMKEPGSLSRFITRVVMYGDAPYGSQPGGTWSISS